MSLQKNTYINCNTLRDAHLCALIIYIIEMYVWYCMFPLFTLYGLIKKYILNKAVLKYTFIPINTNKMLQFSLLAKIQIDKKGMYSNLN